MTRKTAPVLLTLLFLSLSAAQAGAPVIELGRRGEAIPWLDKVKDVPHLELPYSSIPILAQLPQRTAYYEIDPTVVFSAYTYYFYVRSPFGEYMVGSMPNLAKLCHELEVLQELQNRNMGKEFATGVGQGVAGIGTGLGNLIMHPGQSLAGFGHRVRVTGRQVERAVGADPKVGVDERGVDRSNLGMGPAGGERRRLAASLGVDVYTDNPALRKALTDLSQVRAAGSFTTFAIPYHIGLLASFNSLTGDEATEKLIVDFDPYEVRRKVGEDLEPVFGQSRESGNTDLSRLLLNPNYTPREIAYIGRDLLDLTGAANLPLVLRCLANADTPEEADLLALELRLYDFFHRRVSPIKSFVPYLNMYAAIDQNGVFNYLFAGDSVRPWQVTADAFNMMLKEAIDLKARGMTIWVLGDVDAGMIELARAKGVVVRQNIVMDPAFFPAREQMQPAR